ncbi:alpha/beta hydrolase [Rhodovulum sp. YNF3179]|uniref:alpha/beta hydrolase n=1 Tax=Rhodovulum sp. YNF3179 TaxID=3425127 RepID=UPI003D33E575
MALLQVNARRGGLEHPSPCGRPLDVELAETLARIRADAPIVVLIHGFKFSPFERRADPHRHIFSLAPETDCWKALSWPGQLGFTEYGREDGLCIAFGWHATALLPEPGVRRVYGRTAGAAEALQTLLQMIAALAPGRRVDILAHSLGARVALGAMAAVTAPVLGRAILMAAADYRGNAERALANPAARGAQVYNVVSAENDFYDALFETVVPAPRPGDRALGRGLPQAPGRWLDLGIHCPDTLGALADRGTRIAPRDRRVSHWSFYLRPGVFALYAAILRDRDNWSPEALRAALPGRAAAPARTARRLPVGMDLPGRAGYGGAHSA